MGIPLVNGRLPIGKLREVEKELTEMKEQRIKLLSQAERLDGLIQSLQVVYDETIKEYLKNY